MTAKRLWKRASSYTSNRKVKLRNEVAKEQGEECCICGVSDRLELHEGLAIGPVLFCTTCMVVAESISGLAKVEDRENVRLAIIRAHAKMASIEPTY